MMADVTEHWRYRGRFKWPDRPALDTEADDQTRRGKEIAACNKLLDLLRAEHRQAEDRKCHST